MMMDMLGAYSVGSFELRLLTYDVHISPSLQDSLDDSCISCFTAHSAQWLEMEYGFHSCSMFLEGAPQVC